MPPQTVSLNSRQPFFPVLIGTLVIGCCTVLAQAPKSVVSFEVASIRPVDVPPGRGRGQGGEARMDGERLDLPFVSLADLVPYAFRVKDYQVVAPSWVRESHWSISAKLPDGTSPDQVPDMVQALLAERFKLTVHREKREKPVYMLAVAVGGAKLQKASPGDYPAWDGSFPGFGFRGPLQAGPPITGRISPGRNCARRYEFVPLPMAAFADALTLFLGRPVLDETGMTGNYKIVLEVPTEVEAGMMANIMRRADPRLLPGGGRGLEKGGGPVPGGRGGPGGEPSAPPPNLAWLACTNPIAQVFRAFAEGQGEGVGAPDSGVIKAVQQIGLRLQSSKAPIETIVVDHLEKIPTEN